MDPTEKSLTIDQLASGIWRHRMVALICLAASIAVGLIYLAVKPRRYVAETVVRVEAQLLAEQYVQPTVTEQVQNRLATVRHEILSPQVLGKVIEEQMLFPSIVASKGMSAAVQAMRGRIEVKVEGDNAFALRYTGDTPEQAATVANRLPEVYVELALQERVEAAERAAAVFASELERIRPDAEAFESRLTQFKADHATTLPELLESNLRQLDRLNGLTEMALTSLTDAQRRRTAQARYGAESNVEVGRLATMMNEARRELSSVQSIYGNEHPEVISARRAYDAAKRRYDTAAEAAAHGDNEQRRIDGEIHWLKDLAISYQERTEEILRRVEATPAVGAELAAIGRDYDAIREKYHSLLSRKVEAELALDLERRQRTSLFRVVEPALVPLSAAEPKPTSVLGIATLLGLALGLGAAAWAASRDTSIRGVADARQRLGLPVLASVPPLDLANRR
ncbi:MAG TPA: Wzz/FepE/Etk N-terminal domain-containing protein [Vulgatibacter sp.]